VNNQVQLIILQHPQEAHEAKNTARLLHLCLTNSQIHTGEHFEDAFFAEINSSGEFTYNLLLYPETPEEKSLGIMQPPMLDSARINIGDNLNKLHQLRLWVLDATWRKSRKMLYLNPALQAMPRLSLQNCPPSIYKIRKAHSENQLSTLEASCYALWQLEQNLVDYSPIINAFSAFIAEQKTFIPVR
jgi:DTW domain-containing protein YfiP